MELPDGYDTPPRRARIDAVRRPAAATRDRPGVHPARPAADPRRADHRPGRRVGRGRRRRARRAHARQDDDRHLPRPGPDPALGPDPRRLRRPDRRVRSTREDRRHRRRRPHRPGHPSDARRSPCRSTRPWWRPSPAAPASGSRCSSTPSTSVSRAWSRPWTRRSSPSRSQQQLLATGATVEGADVGKVWLREDGTCTLSYRLRVVDATGGSSEHTVLGRVMDSDEAAAEYVRHRVRRMTEMRAGVSGPWQESSAVATGAGLALHPFPIDPALPTLIAATNPSVVSNLVKFAGIEELPTAETVHHPREGACVLRYRFPRPADADMYGKVYGDDSGDAIARNLKALTRGPDGMLIEGPVRFPRPVVYSASLRLLITEALPGVALVPSLLKSILSDTPPRTVKENKTADGLAPRRRPRLGRGAGGAAHDDRTRVGALDVGRPRRPPPRARRRRHGLAGGRRRPPRARRRAVLERSGGAEPGALARRLHAVAGAHRETGPPRSSTSTRCAGPTRPSTSVATWPISTCSRRS